MTHWRELDNMARAIVDGDVDDLREYLTQNVDDIPVCRCERCEEWTHHDDTNCVDDTESWCEYCATNYAHYSERRGGYYTETDDEYPEYHSQHRRRGFRGAIGIEVELQFTSDCEDVLAAADAADVIVESDGSLHEENSAEAITHPFRPDREGMRKLGGLAEFLESVKARGWDLPGYGVHINIDRGKYTRFDVGRTMRFIASNADKVARIAGRSTVYNGSSRGLPIADCCPAYRSIRDDRLGVKYATVNLCPGRIEFRIFQSNARVDGVRRCVRFSRDLLQFGRDAGHRATWGDFVSAYPEWRCADAQ